MEGVLAAFAQFDNDVRSDRTRAGRCAQTLCHHQSTELVDDTGMVRLPQVPDGKGNADVRAAASVESGESGLKLGRA